MVNGCPSLIAAMRSHAFTLVELLIVVVILGILAAVVVPQFTDADDGAREAATQSNLTIVRRQVELYILEHNGRTPAQGETGGIDKNNFATRLLGRTDPDGALNATGPRGPYLTAFPRNLYNDKNDVRVDGPAAGANTHGWRYTTTTGIFVPDDSTDHAMYFEGALPKITGG
ncbi:MAG: type II secretion system protein [Phycisphaerae bacterium]|nr:type II secretion system protein [Phycisphaerae bacterium]